ncbi:MAG: cell division protein FtsZ [Verrucomicrobiota bacterium]|nr:cell division protein FtsZ [Verrucomicrobiota bacterium]
MIQLSRNYSLPEREDEVIPIKVIGIGGAGSNALDRMVLDGLDKSDLIAANTDVQSLASSVAANKVQLGREVTRGLGAGGDPELGYNAAMEAADEMRGALADARLVFLCVGLGGGTGSGAAPVIAELARESGALVITFATMPFTFEGKRRASQAQESLVRLQEISNAVICFENDKLGDIVAPKAGIHQAFAAADLTISQSVRSIGSVIQRPGLIRIGFDDLLSALRAPNARCLFGYGESDSDNRAHDALTQALKNPLMDRGRMLSDAANVLVHVAGGPAMTLSEVEALMGELNRHVGNETQILFGTAVDGRMGNRLAVTLISSLAADGEAIMPAPVRQRPAIVQPQPIIETKREAVRVEPAEQQIFSEAEVAAEAEPIEAAVPEPEPMEEEPVAMSFVEPEPVEPTPAPVAQAMPEMIEPEPAQPRVILPKKKPAAIEKPPQPIEKIVAKQEVMQFESVTRGRFEKSEPTIVEGQDLDVPTFLRKNVRVK